MKTTPMTAFLAILALFLDGLAFAAPPAFNSRSNGSYGPMNITNNTVLDMPADGIFHCMTINVAAGVTLRFNRNPLNTPVYLLAQGDVTISGTIDISGEDSSGATPGRGGPGGFDGGFGPTGNQPGGDGFGPGAGRTSGTPNAVFASPFQSNTNTYGNSLLTPLIGGSGGAGCRASLLHGGGGGGGALLLASSTRVTINGTMTSVGGAGDGGSGGGGCRGSGGAIRVVAPVVTGNGSISVLFVNNNFASGRARIDSIDRASQLTVTMFGKGTRGSQMFVFPAVTPKLDVVKVAGMDIAPGTANPVSVSLPLGTPTSQTVRVQARNFTSDVPIVVAVIPESGPSTRYDGLISQASGNPPFTDVSVTIPLDVVCYIQVWSH